MKGLVWFHRWVGVVLCALFAVWFATGAMMVFVAFPTLPPDDRFAHSEPIDLTRLGVSPSEAAARLPRRLDLRLVSLGGAPVYVGRGPVGQDLAISGQTGTPIQAVAATQAAQIAARFGGAASARVDGPFDYDQWNVHQQFDPLRPFYRVRLADPQATELYVSARTGEVVQRTRGYERACNWLGSVVHWIYFVPVRRTFALWDWTVWWIALAGLSTATAGVWLGVSRTAKKMRSKRPSVSPFRGLMRWHHILGLAAGAFVLSWISSGWLSMDHGRLFSEGTATDQELRAYQGSAAASRTIAATDLQRLGPATRIDFQQVDGHAIAAARGPAGAHILVTSALGAAVYSRLPTGLLADAIQAAWPQRSVSPLAAVPIDGAYAKAEGLPAGALLARLGGGPPLRVYVDGIDGRILVVMDRSREAYAWVYYMLHTYNFPGLSSRPVLRITILLIPLSLGFSFAITGLLVGIRRLRMTAAA
ncbi:MAG TPA: PepSY domain-containing protein [Caulobacteraceae bacterium]